MKNNSFKAEVKQYFDKIAFDLDWWNRRNKYYYQDIQKLHNFIIPSGSNVLEIGCGTGDLLAATNPKLGVGIDFSETVVSIAKDKYPDLDFYCLDAENMNLDVFS
ncbi:MAG: class I SAM-dependent methyltransferase, partial [Sphaerospermopsis kisseleviana]